VKPLLILFRPGARGDFLASALQDIRFEHNSSVVSTPPGYAKKHFLNDPLQSGTEQHVDSLELKNYFSIRISLQTKEDFKRVLYYRFTKPGLWVGHSLKDDLKESVLDEQKFRIYDSKFDQIVPLSNLDDYNLVSILCRRINGTIFSPGTAKSLRDNIQLNKLQGSQWINFCQLFNKECCNDVETYL
jgi:hypothetical protein